MNILIDQLPEAVEIDGDIYDLDTDFRTCLSAILAYEDPELVIHEKHGVMLQLLYKEIPDNQQEACRLGLKFLNCGEDAEGSEFDGEGVGRLYSFEKDAKYIYSAIKQSHNVDLEEIDYLHWWKFTYMFLDLDKDCFFMQMIDLRRKRLEGKLTKEEEQVYNSLRETLELPQYISPEQKTVEDKFMRLLNGE